MVTSVGNILNVIQQNKLLALQDTSRALDAVQQRLATGRKVNSAIDNPDNFFASQALDFRARDLEKLLDGIGSSLRTVEQAQSGLNSINDILATAEAFLENYEKDLISGNIDLAEVSSTDFLIQFNSPVEFENYAAGQDSGIPATIIESGFGVVFDDNVWRRYQVDYDVTADTILEFDFRSTNMPEIAAIGFDNDSDFSNSNSQFFLYGSQTGGISYSAPVATYQYDGSGDWVHVSIPAGTYFTGNFSHLTFITDDDGGGDDGDAQYRNIAIHEGDYTPGQTVSSVSDIYEKRYEAILNQINLLVDDSHYRGISLLGSNDLFTVFNDTKTNSLHTESIDATVNGLGLEITDFSTVEAIRKKIEQVRNAQLKLKRYSSSLSSDYDILSNRNKFTQATINTLKAGSDDLTLSDQNQDGALFLALQTRQAIQVSTFSLNAASIADFLV